MRFGAGSYKFSRVSTPGVRFDEELDEDGFDEPEFTELELDDTGVFELLELLFLELELAGVLLDDGVSELLVGVFDDVLLWLLFELPETLELLEVLSLDELELPDELILDELVLDELTLDELLTDELSLDVLLDEAAPDEPVLDELLFDELSFELLG